MWDWLVRTVLVLVLALPLAACEEDEDDPENREFSTYFTDSFNRADGPVGEPWLTDIPDDGTPPDSLLEIDTQRVNVNSADASPAMFHPDSFDGDVRVSVEAIISGGTYDPGEPIGIFARGSTPSRDVTTDVAYYCSIWDQVVSIVVPAEDDVTIIAAGSSSLSLDDGDSYRLVFTVIGDDLLCQVIADQEIADEAQTENDLATEGYIGLLGGDPNGFLYWDGFLLETR